MRSEIGVAISQPIISISNPKIDENKEIKEFAKKKNIQTVITNEPVGKILSSTFKVLCSECHTFYEYKAQNEIELEKKLKDEGWRSSLDLTKAYCPKCIKKELDKEFKV